MQSARRHCFAVLLLCAAAAAQAPTDVPPGFVLVDDMVLPESAVFGESGFTPNNWPIGLVPYAFAANVTMANQTLALTAMAEVKAITAVDFIPRNNQADYVLITACTVNNSCVGVISGAQVLNIVSWGSKFIIVHELMHALGFVHEQSRPDRGTYVTVNSANVSTTACTGSNCGMAGSSTCICNFDIVNIATSFGAYDFRSVMHYGRSAFSANGADTLTCNSGYTQFQSVIGQRAYLSLGDAAGLQFKYGAAIAPAVTSISPTMAVAGGSSFTLAVNGVRFCGGSADANGVPGTQVLWNGTAISTWQSGPTQVSALVPGALLSVPGTATVTVRNPAPGGGLGSGAQTFTITCPPIAGITLSPSVPQAVVPACVPVAIPPVPLTNFDWHVVAVSSPSDWRLSMGATTSNNAGSVCDFLAGYAYVSPGQSVNPVSGSVSRVGGSDNATVEYVTSAALTVNTPSISGIPAGSIVRAFRFFAGTGPLQLHVSGSSSLRWWLVSPTATFSWRGPANAVASGIVGAGAVSIPTGSFCLVVGRSGGSSTGFEAFTVNLCQSAPPPFTLGAGFLQYLGGPCHPFQFTPQSGRWNVVGVSSTVDWDIGVGSGRSEFGGSSCDYVLANGRLGTVTPGSGMLARYSGTAQGAAMMPITVAASFPGGSAQASTFLMAAFEFEVLTAGVYDLAISGGMGHLWDLHSPGGDASWRGRPSADILSGQATTGVPAVGVPLGVGWHVAVVYRNGGPIAASTLTFTSSVSALTAPTLVSVSPPSALTQAPSFTLLVQGTGFDVNSFILFDGNYLPTTFLSATMLSATVDASLLQSPRIVPVVVMKPGPAANIPSNALTFTINALPPTLSQLSPASALSGNPAFTLNVNGASFAASSVVRWNGAPLTTSFVSATQLQAEVPSSLLQVAAGAAVTVFNPPPNGGSSNSLNFNVLRPGILAISPNLIPILVPASPGNLITIIGQNFGPQSIVHADGEAVPTTLVNSNTLQVTVTPDVPQSQRRGAIAIHVANTELAVSAGAALQVGGGQNAGLIRRQPLSPAPGVAYAALLEGGRQNAIFSLFIDLENPTPLYPFIDGTMNQVLAVSPLAGSAPQSWIAIIDGLGLLGPATGATLDSAGSFVIPGFVRPNPPVGLSLTVQGVFQDPTVPAGFRLTWARYPDQL